ncbi:MAG: HDIG domain-containing metalloprotein, partial [Pseudomonadota bacterium]
VIRILFTSEFAAILSIVSSVIVGVMTDGNFAFSGYVLCSGFIASVLVMRFEERSTLVKAGLWVGIFQMFFAAAMVISKIYIINFSWYHVVYAVLSGFLSGILGAFITEAVIPVFEYFFNYTTNLKLLEFANTNHTLLRDFLIKAPGTYNHSMIVSQLAAAGADETGANSLLARVGSYYHDIGKMGKAVYFIENQQGSINPHDKLNPTMSARILVSHVKDGVKMAKEFKLGSPIVDVIEQHHGTSLMKFFYGKALEQNKEANELDYRYPGPKPKSREAALVMIADSCEAACRTLEDPTPSRIKNTVDAIINSMFTDGQFDECNITLKRLKIISQIFTKILIALHHSRVEYPDLHHTEEQNGNYTDRRTWDKISQKIVDKDGKESSVDSRL